MPNFKFLIASLLFVSGALSPNPANAQVPEDVLDMAKAYSKAYPEATVPAGSEIVDDYVRNFFTGFSRGGGGSSAWNHVVRVAHEQGEMRWQQGRQAQERTFAGFGYARVELSGRWTSWFETSSYKADNLGDSYWLSYLPGLQWDRREVRDRSRPHTLRVHVVGYLSPKGRYGHLGVYGRELFAESTKVLSE